MRVRLTARYRTLGCTSCQGLLWPGVMPAIPWDLVGWISKLLNPAGEGLIGRVQTGRSQAATGWITDS